MRLLAGCPQIFDYRTRYGVRRESATCRAPLNRNRPAAATTSYDAPAGPSLPWAAPGQRKGGPDRRQCICTEKAAYDQRIRDIITLLQEIAKERAARVAATSKATKVIEQRNTQATATQGKAGLLQFAGNPNANLRDLIKTLG